MNRAQLEAIEKSMGGVRRVVAQNHNLADVVIEALQAYRKAVDEQAEVAALLYGGPSRVTEITDEMLEVTGPALARIRELAEGLERLEELTGDAQALARHNLAQFDAGLCPSCGRPLQQGPKVVA